jgi:glyoxylase-like metal-dependent hydrolase (beta-lactamase superfamily II)
MLFAGDLAEDRFFPILPEPDCGGSRWIEVLDELEALGPETVVGGHGDVGDVEIIRRARGYLTDVRDRVGAAGDQDLEELKTELEAHYTERYPDWDNVMWIGSAVEAFRREA